jgi:hypothetical protein
MIGKSFRALQKENGLLIPRLKLENANQLVSGY